MFTPKYQLTQKLFLTIAAVERLYGQIEGLKVPKKLELNLTRKNMIQSAYASNRIEGNPLSEAEVTNLLLDDRVPVNRDEKEVANYFEILQHLDMYAQNDITLKTVTDLHKKLMSGVDKAAGDIRNVQVVVGRYQKEGGDASLRVKHNPPYHTIGEIQKSLQELLTWANSDDMTAVIRAGIFHHHFVYIHPFEDGNGRVCRILTALLFMKAGYMINKYFILDDYYDIDRQMYSDMLHSADSGDKTVWLEYFSEGVQHSLRSAIARFKHAMTTLKFEDQPTPKESEVLRILEREHELTAHRVAESMHVSRQQAHALLRALVDKGLVEKKGITKKSYYVMK